MDKIAFVITSQNTPGGSSRPAITKGIKEKFGETAPAALKADILFLKHDSSIFRQPSNPVSGFSMLGQVGLCWLCLQRAGLALRLPRTTCRLDDCLNMLLSCL